MLIVISDPAPVSNEATFINQLFDEGLAVFHLRKPESTEQEMMALLQKINAAHYPKIALHAHHSIADRFGINRLHIHEAARKQMEGAGMNDARNTVFSTSIHNSADYADLPDLFDYTFLGPVFDSISKMGYKALTGDQRILIPQKKQVQLIALGGINAANCSLPLEWGFDGVAVLGALWKDPAQLIKNFKAIHAVCTTIAR